ncbi:MAG TPA: TIR domain-containing protein, partial [Candidatus Angelobacter sp.]|nr:TIR domain-containing protein [Candidatus Angelobacter sp.]
MSEPSPSLPAKLFCSYSHKDNKLRERLENHLSTLHHEKLISAWNDRKIAAGTEWHDQIDDHLKDARIILLLVSADFIASPYCNDIELRHAMERHRKGKARVIPVILRPTDWMATEFGGLQALPADGKPVTTWRNRDAAFLNIAAGIRLALRDMSSGSSPAAVNEPAATATLAHSRLRPSPYGFIGRERDLKELTKIVKTGRVTICSIQGMGGVGKTALALKFAESLAPSYPDGQFDVNLRGDSKEPVSARDAMAHVIRTYGFTAEIPAEEFEASALYRSILSKKKALLLMDNARDEAQVEPLIPPAGCLLLVTSRKRLGLPGLRETNLDVLQPRFARVLLRRIASRKMTEKTASDLARLCGYLPLALRAVGSALKIRDNLTPAAYVRTLADNRLKNLTTVDASLQASYDLLSPELQQRFAALAVFPDTFDAQSAAAIWCVTRENAREKLGNLLEYSLVGFNAGTKRYRLNELVRLFSSARLQPEEQEILQERHASYYCDFLETLENLYLRGGESVTRALDLFDLEWGNIKSGQRWSNLHSATNAVAVELCLRYPL